ncbi:MAG: arginine--tRNA ligase [Zetaproteobacteria bacterium]|nr:arginine--tRNA ligase [Zetaproteobacteria bacterium]
MELARLQYIDPAKAQISEALVRTFTQLAEDAASVPRAELVCETMSVPPDAVLGQLSLPCFRFAKSLGMKPVDLASRLAELLQQASLTWVDRIETKGPFLNFFYADKTLAEFLLTQSISGEDVKAVVRACEDPGRKTMVEYSQPNTHKEFHIGHVRGTCFGDAISRILAYVGYDVMPVNYFGDEGTHTAKCIWQLEKDQTRYTHKPQKDLARWYNQYYVRATQAFEAAEGQVLDAYKAEVSAILKGIENKSGKYYDLWRQSRDECLADFKQVYQWLGAKFDHDFTESEVSEASQAIVDEYLEAGLFQQDQGAIGLSLEEHKLGFFMARKSDGSSLYITKDLALARSKFADFNVAESIYVVGSEQTFHFQQLFKVLELMGFEQAQRCRHVPLAHVKLPEGKMSSRKGTAVSFATLKSLVLEEVAGEMTKYREEWSAEELEQTTYRLALGAIRYGMLSSEHEIVFDPKTWTSFEGNTGPYLMYSYSRASSMLRAECFKIAEVTVRWPEQLLSEEKLLLLHLYRFNQAARDAAEKYKPSVMAHYLFDLCKYFNRMYAHVPVRKEQDSALREMRLAIVALFRVYLARGLDLLGIQPVERM